MTLNDAVPLAMNPDQFAHSIDLVFNAPSAAAAHQAVSAGVVLQPLL